MLRDFRPFIGQKTLPGRHVNRLKRFSEIFVFAKIFLILLWIKKNKKISIKVKTKWIRIHFQNCVSTKSLTTLTQQWICGKFWSNNQLIKVAGCVYISTSIILKSKIWEVTYRVKIAWPQSHWLRRQANFRLLYIIHRISSRNYFSLFIFGPDRMF